MLSIPACKGFEIGHGFASSSMRGSEHNRYSGGILGGIANGESITIRAAFKPTSSVRIPQKTITKKGKSATLTLPKNMRHDPCVAIRGAIVVEAMAACVLADQLCSN
ncbi:MAG: hypothetical protein ChlgKO_08750 [Chlamydiales bacterium]